MPDLDPIVPTTPAARSWRFIAASAAGSLVVHCLVATAIYVEFTHPALPAADPPTVEVALISPEQLKPADPLPLPKQDTKVEPPKPADPPKPPAPPPPQQVEKPKPPPFKADPSQVVPATRDQATPPQGDQAAPTNAKRESAEPDKPNTQDAKQADPQPDPDQSKPEPPKQVDAKPPEDPKPADPNGILPKQAPPKPQLQASTQPNKPAPSKRDGAGQRQVMAPVVVRADQFNGRAGSSDRPSYPSSARANGLQGRVTLQALVGNDGNVRRINIVKSSGYDELDESAVRAVWLWRFHATGPIPAQGEWIEIPVDFRLH
jgi:protein TonB